jgi:hypothetical protein
MEWTFVTDSREVGDGPDAASGESPSSYADSGMLADRFAVLDFADDEDIVGSNAEFSSEKAVRSSVRADGSPEPRGESYVVVGGEREVPAEKRWALLEWRDESPWPPCAHAPVQRTALFTLR